MTDPWHITHDTWFIVYDMCYMVYIGILITVNCTLLVPRKKVFVLLVHRRNLIAKVSYFGRFPSWIEYLDDLQLNSRLLFVRKPTNLFLFWTFVLIKGRWSTPQTICDPWISGIVFSRGFFSFCSSCWPKIRRPAFKFLKHITMATFQFHPFHLRLFSLLLLREPLPPNTVQVCSPRTRRRKSSTWASLLLQLPSCVRVERWCRVHFLLFSCGWLKYIYGTAG